jgi:hypothetical protein
MNSYQNHLPFSVTPYFPNNKAWISYLACLIDGVTVEMNVRPYFAAKFLYISSFKGTTRAGARVSPYLL